MVGVRECHTHGVRVGLGQRLLGHGDDVAVACSSLANSVCACARAASAFWVPTNSAVVSGTAGSANICSEGTSEIVAWLRAGEGVADP